METVILAEKPSTARDIARALKAKSEKDHHRAGDYIVVWAMGHLLEIDDGIVPKKWSLEDLPLFPEKFLYKVANKHFYTLREFIQRAKKVIIATDAGREGELIARLILMHAGWKNWENTYRFWTSSALTEEVVLKTLQGLRPAKEFDSLFYCALARQHADWLVGINLTRAVSLLAGNGVWSVGRVQTPTLALVVKRTLERENFKPEPYFVINAVFEKDGKAYKGHLVFRDIEEDQEERLSEEKARQIVSELEREKTGIVEKVLQVKKSEPPPKLFSLTSLQRKANELFGWSASKTLKLAQELYEELKCISYPRTDAEHLSESNRGLVKEVLRKLKAEHLIERVDKVGKRVFDDSKLTDHHAIIPLDQLRSENKDHKMLYELIKNRFLAVFMDDFVYLSLKVITKLGRYTFVSFGRKVLNLGWREMEDRQSYQDLSFLKEKDRVLKKELKLEKKWTQPPPAYTEGTLLKEMERLGLGTPATRSHIIDTLKERKYVVLHKKHLIATEKGKALIEFLGSSKLKDWELTSEWEKKLEEIYKGKMGREGYEDFLREIKDFVKKELENTFLKDYNKAQGKVLRDLSSPLSTCQLNRAKSPKSGRSKRAFARKKKGRKSR